MDIDEREMEGENHAKDILHEKMMVKSEEFKEDCINCNFFSEIGIDDTGKCTYHKPITVMDGDMGCEDFEKINFYKRSLNGK